MSLKVGSSSGYKSKWELIWNDCVLETYVHCHQVSHLMRFNMRIPGTESWLPYLTVQLHGITCLYYRHQTCHVSLYKMTKTFREHFPSSISSGWYKIRPVWTVPNASSSWFTKALRTIRAKKCQNNFGSRFPMPYHASSVSCNPLAPATHMKSNYYDYLTDPIHACENTAINVQYTTGTLMLLLWQIDWRLFSGCGSMRDFFIS